MKILDVPQSGSIAGQTSSRNRFGQYRRTRAVPVNVNSPAQVAVRGYLIGASQAWRSLTDAQRAAWDAYALDHPRLDALGQTITLTGHQMFVSTSIVMTSSGQVFDGTAVPGNLAVPVALFEVGSAAASTFALNNLIDFTTSEVVVQIFSSPPVTAGVNFNGDYRLIANTAAPDVDDPVCTAAQLSAKWGTLAAGQKFFFRSVGVSPNQNVGGGTELSVVLT